MENELLGNILNNIVMEKAVRDKIVMQQKQQREEEARKRKEADRDELDDAFKVYKQGILNIEPRLRGLPTFVTKSAFLYMIEKMQIPSTRQLIFYLLKKHDDVVAERLNISVLLYNLILLADQQGEQGFNSCPNDDKFNE